jgi:hypothetical protein
MAFTRSIGGWECWRMAGGFIQVEHRSFGGIGVALMYDDAAVRYIFCCILGNMRDRARMLNVLRRRLTRGL